MKLPVPFDRPFTLADARANGITRATVRGWLERGEARQLAYGLFSPALAQGNDPVRSTRAVADGLIATSYLGAAEVHGLLVPPDVYPPMRSPVRLERIPSEHRWLVGQVRLASPAWTALSIARHQQLPSRLVPLDSALRKGISRDDLSAAAKIMHGWPGSSGLESAVALADERSESALESLARGSFIVSGLPAPELQVEVVANRRRYRPDFLWPAARLILEIDGLSKYGDQQDILKEKRRHNDLQSAGFTVLRCGFVNLYPRPDVLVAQIHRLLRP